MDTPHSAPTSPAQALRKQWHQSPWGGEISPCDAKRSVGLTVHLVNVSLGLAAGILAVALRLLINLPADVLPFFLVVIAICIVTVVAGLWGGITTMVVGGIATWYFLLDPSHSWDLYGAGAYTLLGYLSVTAVILATSQLYRRSEQKRQGAALQLARQEARHQQLFAREMSHRLKNAMTIVQALASQTFHGDDPEVSKFEGRVRALADAHNLLNEHVKQPIALVSEVVETAISPFDESRFDIGGATISLPDQLVVSLSLVLHELATNAIKYGALSYPKGWISINWNHQDGWFTLDWKEHDGPAVTSPVTQGFGSRLLARAAMGATLEFESDGLRCTFKCRV